MKISRTALRALAFAFLLAAPAAASAGTAQPGPAEASTRIVDCQLPAQVRKLGPGTVQMIPGAIVRISADECRARNGAALTPGRTASR